MTHTISHVERSNNEAGMGHRDPIVKDDLQVFSCPDTDTALMDLEGNLRVHSAERAIIAIDEVRQRVLIVLDISCDSLLGDEKPPFVVHSPVFPDIHGRKSKELGAFADFERHIIRAVLSYDGLRSLEIHPQLTMAILTVEDVRRKIAEMYDAVIPYFEPHNGEPGRSLFTLFAEPISKE